MGDSVLRGPTADEIRRAALRRAVAARPVVWVPLFDVEPDLAERIGLAYGGCPAYDGDVPVATAHIVLDLTAGARYSLQCALIRAVTGCGTLSAHTAREEARHERQKRGRAPSRG